MPPNKKSLFQTLLHKQKCGQIDTFFSLNSLDFQKIGIVLKKVGTFMAAKEKFRAVLEYDSEVNKYYVSIKFYGCDIPEEIRVIQKAEVDYLANKR